MGTKESINMSKILPIIQMDNPNLRKTSVAVKDIFSPKVQSLIEDLIETVMHVGGVGIAAPQVDKLYQIFILACHPTPNRPSLPSIDPIVVINPRILTHSDEQIVEWEACLSVDTPSGRIRKNVPRWSAVRVSYIDQNGQLQEQEFTGFLARIFQHEYDHLQGKLFLDRVE
jgi:peptide deformylase